MPEVGPGTVVAGFRIERALPKGTLGRVYEATQLSLDRTVALRLLPLTPDLDPDAEERFEREQRVGASIHHRNLVPIYEAGAWIGGRFVATRFIRGSTLPSALADGRLSADRVASIREQIGDALEAVHRAGLVHGRVGPQNVLIDGPGEAYLADLGLGRGGAAEADRAGLESLASAGPRRRRGRMIAPVGLVALSALVLVLLLTLGDRGAELEAGSAEPFGCSSTPSANTPACTVAQAEVDGDPAAAEVDGVIRSWSVEGATGELTLQVIGRSGERIFLRSFSQEESVPDAGSHRFETGVPVRRGDRMGVLLGPGAEIGLDPGGDGDEIVRWEGTAPFAPERYAADLLGGKLSLEVEIDAGASIELPQVSGAEATTLADGEPLGEQPVSVGEGSRLRAALLELDGEVFVDSLRGKERLARLALADLDPDGRVLSFDGFCGFRQGFCLRWLNPGGGDPVIHAYRLGSDGRFELIG